MSRHDNLPSDFEPCCHCRRTGRVAGLDCPRCAGTGFAPRGTPPCPCRGCREAPPEPVAPEPDRALTAADLWGGP